MVTKGKGKNAKPTFLLKLKQSPMVNELRYTS